MSIKYHLIFFISKIASRLFFFESFVTHYCTPVSNKKSLLGKIINLLFWPYYYNLPIGARSDIQTKLMGGKHGIDWAEHYDQSRETFPPKKGTKSIGNLDWHQVYRGIFFAENLISEKPKDFCLIQLGASSGKEVSYFAQKFKFSKFIYTDLYEPVTTKASRKIILPNLSYLTCSAEYLPAIAEVSNRAQIIIYSSGSAQYVYPEMLDYMFFLFSKIKNKTIHLIFDEIGNNRFFDLRSYPGSIPRNNFSYSHNYSFYAKKYNFKVNEWNIIEPFLPIENFNKKRIGTVHLNGFFTKK